jgi:hypothetical protein
LAGLTRITATIVTRRGIVNASTPDSAPESTAGIATGYADHAETPSPAAAPRDGGSKAALDAERRRVDLFAREQFRLIREARQAFLADQRAAESDWNTRRQELERRSQILEERSQALDEREKRLAEPAKEAAVDRQGHTPDLGFRESQLENDWVRIDEAARALEVKALHRQLHALQEEFDKLQAGYDQALDQVGHLRDQIAEREQFRAERDHTLIELQRLRIESEERDQQRTKAIDHLTFERDQARSLFEEVQDQLADLEAVQRQDLEQLEIERREVLLQNQDLLAQLQRAEEVRQELETLRGERDAALRKVEEMNARLEEEKNRPRPEEQENSPPTVPAEAEKLTWALAERDAALAQVEQLHRRLAEETQGRQDFVKLDAEYQRALVLIHQLHEQQQAWAREHHTSLEWVQAERDTARGQLAELQSRFAELEHGRQRLDALEAEHQRNLILIQQLRDQRDESQQMHRHELRHAQAECDAARSQALELQQRLAEMERVQAERNAAPPPPAPKPEDWAAHELEFAELHREIAAEKKRLEEQARELRVREAELRTKMEHAEQELARTRAELEAQTGKPPDWDAQLEQERQRVREQTEALRLREAELHELRAIADQQSASERAELTQERLRIARLREALRVQEEAWQAKRNPCGKSETNPEPQAPGTETSEIGLPRD